MRATPPFVANAPEMKPRAALLLAQTLLVLAPAVGADTRLAIGTLGLAPEGRNAALADLITAHLLGLGR